MSAVDEDLARLDRLLAEHKVQRARLVRSMDDFIEACGTSIYLRAQIYVRRRKLLERHPWVALGL